MAALLSPDGRFAYYSDPIEYQVALRSYNGTGPYPVYQPGQGFPALPAPVRGRPAFSNVLPGYEPPYAPAPPAGRQGFSQEPRVRQALPPAVLGSRPSPYAVDTGVPGFAPGPEGGLPAGYGTLAQASGAGAGAGAGTPVPDPKDPDPPEKPDPNERRQFLPPTGSVNRGPEFSGPRVLASGPQDRINFSQGGQPVFTGYDRYGFSVDYPLPPAIANAIRGRRGPGATPRGPVQLVADYILRGEAYDPDPGYSYPDLDPPGSPGVYRTLGGLPRFSPQTLANMTASERQVLGVLANRTGNRAEDYFEQSRRLGQMPSGGAGAYAGAPRRRY